MWKAAGRHKIFSAFVAVAVLWSGWYAYGKFNSASAETRYVLEAVQRGTLVASVSGSGQVSASNQFDVKPKVSGNVVSVGVKEGQKVSAGTLLIQLDSTDARKAVRDAESNLDAARLSLEKLKLSSTNIDKLVEDAFAEISNAFLDFPGVISTIQEVLASETLNPKSQSNSDFYKDFVGQKDDANFQKVSLFVNSALSDYSTARSDYDDAFILYKNTDRYASQTTIETLLANAITSAKSISQALKSQQNLLDFLVDYASTNSKKLPALISTYKDALKTNIGLINGDLSNLTSINNSIQNSPLDIRSQQISITQKENSLNDAKENLSNYDIHAPFDGIVAKLNVKQGDSASGGTAVVTMINLQKIAEISLNEVDVSKIKINQKTTLTFDAIPDLTITGKVVQIDTIGSIAQGVVTYSIKIAFDTEDSRVRPGMSVSAAIITDTKQDVLLVPNAAVKPQGGAYYVEILDTAQVGSSSLGVATTQGIVSKIQPRRQSVEIGLLNDSATEITGGLAEGDFVVVRTVTGSSQGASQTQSSAGGLRIPGIGGGGFR